MKSNYRKHYLHHLFGRTYSSESDRVFPVMRNPQTYLKWDEENGTDGESGLTIAGLLENEDDIYVSSDHHFGHQNIIRYANRPFGTADETDAAMIERHNDVVSPESTVFMLGDIAFCNVDKANDILRRMHGYKILIIGNHDWDKKGALKQYAVQEKYMSYYIEIGGKRVLMTHAPFDSTVVIKEGLINLHGHIHQNDIGLPNWRNMCVEHIDYTPLKLLDAIK